MTKVTPKVTVHDAAPSKAPQPREEGSSPTQTLIRDAVKEASITDALGRRLTLRKPDVLAQYRIVKLVGGETAKNEVYMGMIQPIIFLHAIDGDQVFFPRTESELEANIQRLGDEGLAAVMACMMENWGKLLTDEEKAAAIKK